MLPLNQNTDFPQVGIAPNGVETGATALKGPHSGVIKVDINEYGFKSAGKHEANPEALGNLLNDIRNGFIVDVNEDEEAQRKEKAAKEKEIGVLQSQKAAKESALRIVQEVEIPGAHEEISGLRQQENLIDIEKEKKKTQKEGPGFKSNFNLNIYWPVFFMATIFLYGFYTSAFYTAFFMDIAKAASTATADNISSLFNTAFNIEAFKVFNLHWFAPIIFFVFALVLHIFFESKSRHRRASLAGMLSLILIADCLLAYFIEYNSHMIHELNGLADPDWAFYSSPRFYLVLFLGFFTCLGWSLILYAIKEELHKEDPDKMAELLKQPIREKTEALKAKIEELKTRAITLEGEIREMDRAIQQMIEQLRQLIYNVSDLDKRITAFYDGWLRYVNGLKNKHELISANEAVMTTFRAQHLIKTAA